MKNEELFDQRVELFLKKQMTDKEELEFKKELSSDPEKLSRAKIIALAVKQMKSASKSEDVNIVNSIKSMPHDKYEDVVNGKFISNFDEEVTRFLKGQMNAEEEKAFRNKVESSSELSLRAKTIALAISQMKNSHKASDEEVINAIKRTDNFVLKKLAGFRHKYITLKWTVGIAASLLLLFGVGFHQSDIQQTKDLGNAYGGMFCDVQSISRGSVADSIVIDRLSDTFRQIQNGDSLSVAINFLTRVYDGYSNKDFAGYEDYDAYIAWNLAIAHLKMGHKKQAKPILLKLINDYNGTPLSKKAKELVDKL